MGKFVISTFSWFTQKTEENFWIMGRGRESSVLTEYTPLVLAAACVLDSHGIPLRTWATIIELNCCLWL